MVVNIIVAFLLQIVFTVGIIFLFGWLIAICNKKFYSNFGNASRTVCYATGFIGTPVHELSHALFCLIFGHKIVEIKLFQINSADGTLGYVNHTYNPKNIYHRIGNFFIGVAPITVISTLLFAASYFLLPSFYQVIIKFAEGMSLNNIGKIFEGLGTTIVTFFSLAATWQWWIFLIVGLLLCLHMTLSGADIKGAISGLVFVLISFLIVDVILELVSHNLLVVFTKTVMSIGSYLLCFLIWALIITIFALVISFIFKGIIRKRTI